MKELKVAFKNEGVFTLKEKTRYCRHPRIEIDPDMRTMTCQDCGSYVDPFDWIYRQAISESVDLQRIIALKKDIEKLHREKINLLNEIGKINNSKKGK